MIGNRLLVALLAVAFAARLGCAQVNTKTAPPPSQLDTLRAQGYEALYNLDYEGARRRFSEMTRLYPDHPAGPQCYAASLWLEELNQSWRLKASLYDNDSYAAGNKANQKLVEEFRVWTRRAKTLAEERLRKNSADIESLYLLGATEGLESVFAAGVERRFLAALRSGSRSVDRHREVLKLAPDYRDAELTIGLYNYVIGSLPLAMKIVVGTMGHKGSKRRGLETLERVANEGHWARDVARVLLVDLYKREKRWQDAAAMATDLSARYPKNYLFKLQLADALSNEIAGQDRKNTAAATNSQDQQRIFDIFERLLRDNETAAAAADIIHFRYGEALATARQYERAAREFLQVTKRSSESGLIAMARLRAAQSLDLAGKRSEALAEYRAVLAGPDITTLHQDARRGLREPYKPIVK